MAEVVNGRLLGPAALAAYLQHSADAPDSASGEPPLWRLLLTPRWLARLQLRRLSAADLVRLHSLPDTVAALAGRGVSLLSRRPLESLYRWHGFAQACLTELRSPRHTSRAETARGLLQEAGSGLSNEAVDHLLGMDVSAAMQATRVTRALGLQARVEHACSDLTCDPVPVADTYFLFFSFPAPTAAHVLSQIESIAQHRRISLIVHGGWPGGGLERVGWLARQPRLGPLEHYISTGAGSTSALPEA